MALIAPEVFVEITVAVAVINYIFGFGLFVYIVPDILTAIYSNS